MRALLLLALVACSEAAPTETLTDSKPLDPSCPEPRVYKGTTEFAEGDVIEDPRGLHLDNGVARVRYGAHAMDFRDTGVTTENYDQPFSHTLAVRHTDHPDVAAQGCLGACHNGTHWHDAHEPWWGDGTAWTSGTAGDADRARVTKLTADEVEVVFEWDEVRLDTLRAEGQCVIGQYPECGPTAIDHEGQVIYQWPSFQLPKAIHSVELFKVVRLSRCDSGYFTALRSNPPIIHPDGSAKGPRLGYSHTVVAWSCDGTHVVRHPEAQTHADLGVTNCIADIPAQVEGHGSWPFVRFMLTTEPVQMRSLQYTPTQLGSPGPRELLDVVGPDGRPWPYQAFIGAVEYVPGDIGAEPLPSTRALVEGAFP